MSPTFETGVFEVGKFYRVPCVLTDAHTWLRSGWQTVIGPMHSDDGAVNFPHSHWHIDLRFISIPSRWNVQFLAGTPIMKNDLCGRPVVIAGPELRLRKCKREMPIYPFPRAKWLAKLNEECAHLRMKNMVCPHRGLPLSGCPMDGDVVTCPGHGLRWNIKTGELVR